MGVARLLWTLLMLTSPALRRVTPLYVPGYFGISCLGIGPTGFSLPALLFLLDSHEHRGSVYCGLSRESGELIIDFGEGFS